MEAMTTLLLAEKESLNKLGPLRHN